MYGQQSEERLRDRQGYELWLLDYLRGIRLGEPAKKALTINRDGTVLTAIAITERMGERLAQEVIESLCPLIFLCGFKLLDTIFEWILEEHRAIGAIQNISWRFAEKLDQLDELKKSSRLHLPHILASEPNLFQILFSLYALLTPFRGAVVHSHTFECTPTKLKMTEARTKQTLEFSSEQLFDLAVSMTTISRILQGQPPTDKDWRRLKASLDSLQPIHGGPLYHVARPSGVIVQEVLTGEMDSDTGKCLWQIDLGRAWEVFESRCKTEEDFDYRVTGVRPDGSSVTWIIPSERLPKIPTLRISEDDPVWGPYKVISV